MKICKSGYELNEDDIIPERCHVYWDGDFYPTTCKECPHYKVDDIHNMTTEEVDGIIGELLYIVTELDARNIGANSVIEKYHGVCWTDLCEKGIELFDKIK